MSLVDYVWQCFEVVVIVLALLLVGLMGWVNVALRRDLKMFKGGSHGSKENAN